MWSCFSCDLRIRIFIMGSSANKAAKDEAPSNRPASQSAYSEDEGLWEDIVQTSECCGCVRTKITRKKITWEDRFIRNCSQIAKEYIWAKDLIGIVKTSTLSKQNYLSEINDLKKMAYSQNFTSEVVDSPQDLEKFKKKLKKSLVVALEHTVKPQDRQDRHLKPENSFCQSIQRSRFQHSRYKNSMASSHLQAKLRKQVMSKVEDQFSDIMGERSITRSTHNELQLFIRFTNMLERHLKDIFCILGGIQRYFIEYIQKTYQEVKNMHEAACKTLKDLVNDVTQYLELLKESIFDYYNLKVFRQSHCHNSFLNNQENILSVCTTLLFSHSGFYNTVFENVAEFCKEKDKKLGEITKKIAKAGPEEFFVSQKFCLNLKTLHSQCKGIKREEEKEDTEVSKNQEKSEGNEDYNPYGSCVSIIRNLSLTREPINKMKVLISCSEMIPLAIEKFYTDHDLPKDHWLLDADQVLSIFCFIIAKAQIPHLHAHLFLLENFSTNHQMMTISGYYMSVLSCAVEQIMKDDEYGLIDAST